MSRRPATIAAFLTFVLSVAAFAPAGQVRLADDKTTRREAELKQLAGRWTRTWEEKVDRNTIRRWRMDLEFVDGKLHMCIFDEKGVQHERGSARVIGVDHAGSAPRLKTDGGEVYYDHVIGGKLVVIGWINQWSFPPLSGEYQRAENGK